MKNLITLRAAVLLAASSATLSAADVKGDAAAGKGTAMVCGACHGADGNSMMPDFPKIAGQGAGYTAKQLADFKAGTTRNNAIMSGQVAALNAQDMADVAAYFASQKASMGAADASKVGMGETIYRAGAANKGLPACIACHGPSGEGVASAKYPALAGQHSKYTVTQLQAFAKSDRANDANGIMRDVAAKMSTAEMEAVASYIAGLH